MYELTIKVSTAQELEAVAKALAALDHKPDKPKMEESKPDTPSKPPKVEPIPEKTEEQKPVTPETMRKPEPVPDAIQGITKADIQKAFMAKIKAGASKEHMREILKAYGADRISALDPSSYFDVLKEIDLMEVC